MVGSQQRKSAVLTSHTLYPLNNAAVIELRRRRGCQLGELHKSAPLCASSQAWLARRPGKICVHSVIPLKPKMLSRQDKRIDKAAVFFAVERVPQPWRVAYWDAYDETLDCAENLVASTSNSMASGSGVHILSQARTFLGTEYALRQRWT